MTPREFSYLIPYYLMLLSYTEKLKVAYVCLTRPRSHRFLPKNLPILLHLFCTEFLSSLNYRSLVLCVSIEMKVDISYFTILGHVWVIFMNTNSFMPVQLWGIINSAWQTGRHLNWCIAVPKISPVTGATSSHSYPWGSFSCDNKIEVVNYIFKW